MYIYIYIIYIIYIIHIYNINIYTNGIHSQKHIYNGTHILKSTLYSAIEGTFFFLEGTFFLLKSTLYSAVIL